MDFIHYQMDYKAYIKLMSASLVNSLLVFFIMFSLVLALNFESFRFNESRSFTECYKKRWLLIAISSQVSFLL